MMFTLRECKDREIQSKITNAHFRKMKFKFNKIELFLHINHR